MHPPVPRKLDKQCAFSRTTEAHLTSRESHVRHDDPLRSNDSKNFGGRQIPDFDSLIHEVDALIDVFNDLEAAPLQLSAGQW